MQKSPRMSGLRVTGQFFNYNICLHNPTEEKSGEAKDSLCDGLDRIYNDCPNKDVNIIAGNMNTKVENTVYMLSLMIMELDLSNLPLHKAW
jgi:hypothetical protein